MGTVETDGHEERFIGGFLPFVDGPCGDFVIAHLFVFGFEGVAVAGGSGVDVEVFSVPVGFRVAGSFFE